MGKIVELLQQLRRSFSLRARGGENQYRQCDGAAATLVQACY
jgi:hypothetical protein